MRFSPFLIFSLSLTLIACDQQSASAPAPVQQAAAPQSQTSPIVPEATSTALPPTLAPMLARVSPAVVNISVQGTVRAVESPLLQDPFFRQFFNFPGNTTPQQNAPTERFKAVGSGVIYDAQQGYVITNNHVVDHADKIQVTLKDRRQLDAKLVAADPQTDVAVLKVEPHNLTALPLGDSKALRVGDYVVAIGDPFGVGQTATFGIVSAVGRTGLGIEGYEDFIQTDASINPGNSGGALVDVAGRLVGINAAIITRGGGNVGIGLAIPIDMVKAVAQQLIAHGKVTRGELGIVIQDLTPSLARAMGISAPGGVVVSQVKPGSAAAKAGLAQGDVITAMNGQAIVGSSRFRNSVGEMQPGAVVHLTVLRDGRQRMIDATLELLTSNAVQAGTSNTPNGAPLLGLTVSPIPEEDSHYGKLRGAYVAAVDPGSEAEEAGLETGDIIVSAAHLPVTSPGDLARIVRQQKKGAPLLLQIWRGDATIFVAVG